MTGAGGPARHLLVAVMIGAVGVSSLPDSAPRRVLEPVARPVLQGAGLDQRWPIFAPDPRRVVLGLYAVIEHTDGTTARWTLPDDGRLIGAYRTYRWRKLLEHATSVPDGVRLWAGLADWIARSRPEPYAVARITLFRRIRVVGPPGQHEPRHPTWVDERLFTSERAT